MENNEIMNYEDIEVIEDEVVADEKSGISTCAAVGIGAGVAIAVGAIAKFVKKKWAEHKAKKALRVPDHETEIEDAEVTEIADE